MWDHRVGRACAELSAAQTPSEMPAPASENLTRDGGSSEENRASVEGRGRINVRIRLTSALARSPRPAPPRIRSIPTAAGGGGAAGPGAPRPGAGVSRGARRGWRALPVMDKVQR